MTDDAVPKPCDLVPFAAPAIRPELASSLAGVMDLVRRSISDGTRQVYGRAILSFNAWCEQRRVASMPAEPMTVAAFVAEETARGLTPKFLRIVLSAIRAAHMAQGHTSPTENELVRRVIGGAARSGNHPDRRKRPLISGRELDAVLTGVNQAIEDAVLALQELDQETATSARHRARLRTRRNAIEAARLAGIRDRAILLMGFAGALRRSEIAGMRVGHVRRDENGLIVLIPRSKADQEGKGRQVGIPPGKRFCPIVALEAWQDAGKVRQGPIFRRLLRSGRVMDEGINGASIACMVKARAVAAGLDAAQFSGHSLRAGYLTSAGRAGTSIWKMMDHAGQKSVDVTRGYVRDMELFAGLPQLI